MAFKSNALFCGRGEHVSQKRFDYILAQLSVSFVLHKRKHLSSIDAEKWPQKRRTENIYSGYSASEGKSLAYLHRSKLLIENVRLHGVSTRGQDIRRRAAFRGRHKFNRTLRRRAHGMAVVR